MILEREHLNKVNYRQEKFERENEKEHLENDNSGKEESEKGQL